MKIFSHRGLGFGMPENTLSSYETALKNGFGLEIDVQKTKDDKLIISHDTSLKRQTGIDKNLIDMSIDEIKSIDLGNFQGEKYGGMKIPSFEEVLELFKKFRKKGEFLAIHVKDEKQGDILDLVISFIKKFQIEEDCFIFDLTTVGAEHVKLLNPKIKIGLSIGEKRYGKTIYLWDDVKDCLELDIIWWDEWNSELYDKKNFDKIKNSGKLIYAVSPELHKVHNHPKSNSLESIKNVWKDLIEWGVEGIGTNYPKELEEFVYEGEKT